MNEVIYYLQYSSPWNAMGSWVNEHFYYGEDMEQMESDVKSMAKKYPNRSWRILKYERTERRTSLFEILRKENDETS